MDIGYLYSSSTDLRALQSRQQTTSNPKRKDKTAAKVKDSTGSGETKAMVDNKGWRKKIGSKPKELPPLKHEARDTVATPPTELLSAIDTNERRRHGWRKTIAVSRPSTPMTPAPPTPTPDDTEDIRSEWSEASTPRRDSKPKLNRYTSMFATHKEEASESIFSEPWSLDKPPTQEDPWSYVDPIVTMESVYSHMCKNYMVPIPLDYTSGLFQVFDDYRKLRSHKELIKEREWKSLDRARKVTAQWHQSEILYEAEIRRLELLIARGTTGMAGLVAARRDTVVDRKRQQWRTASPDRKLSRFEHMSSIDLDEKIRVKTQQVLLYRSSSPSEKMTALSRHLTDAPMPTLPAGTFHSSRETILSRKVKSELNLTDLRQTDSSHGARNEVASESSSTTRDVEKGISSQVDQLAESALECDVLIALKELGSLVARRRGLNVSQFIDGLMTLLISADPARHVIGGTAYDDQEDGSRVLADDATPRPSSRRPRSLTYPDHGQTRRRHFSFEPGDDQMRELGADLKTYNAPSHADSTDSGSSPSSAFRLFDDGFETDGDHTDYLLASPNGDLRKPTLIPSPVQTMGRVRRENSNSSLQSIFVKNIRDERHNSRSSIQTAFREGASTCASFKSKSRSSSRQNMHAAESPLGSKERLDSPANRRSHVALAAARAADAWRSNPSRSDTRLSTTTSFSRKRLDAGQQRTENGDPRPHSNAGRKDVE